MDNKMTSHDDQDKGFIARHRNLILYFLLGFAIASLNRVIFPDDNSGKDTDRSEMKAFYYDFRKTKWGMSPDEVQAAERLKNSRFVEVKTVNEHVTRFIYEDFTNPLVTNIEYSFLLDDLRGADYIFNVEPNNRKSMEEEFYRIMEEVTAKYGKPKLTIDNTKGIYKDFAYPLKAEWDTCSTEITLLLRKSKKDNKYELRMNYGSKTQIWLSEYKTENYY